MRNLMLELLFRIRGDDDPGPVKQFVGSWILRNVPSMLTCVEFEEFVHDYHEDLLPAKVRRRFEDHMKLCPTCRVHFESYVKAVELGRRVCEDDEQLPDGMPKELVGAILQARSREP